LNTTFLTTLFCGWITNSSGFNTDFVYSQDDNTGQEYLADYGLGAMTTLTYTLDQGLWGHPVEFGFQLGLLNGNTDIVTPPTSCGIDTYHGLISDCQDGPGVNPAAAVCARHLRHRHRC